MNLIDTIMRLERRLLVVEATLEIEADTCDLVHPKAARQAVAQAKLKVDHKAEQGIGNKENKK